MWRSGGTPGQSVTGRHGRGGGHAASLTLRINYSGGFTPEAVILKWGNALW
ncbi:hypothetical protein JOD54_002995 [Actinokineospora baliensis]|nr:hypothetical protein [Actinokineospora baliensis]